MTEREWEHNDQAICRHCDGKIVHIHETAWAGTHVEVLNAWWSHHVHPADGHDAEPVGYEDVLQP